MSISALAPGQELEAGSIYGGDRLVSPNGRFTLIMQTDGNLCLYDGLPSASTCLWASGTSGLLGQKLVMQTDGNLVIYGPPHLPNNGAMWASNTSLVADHYGCYLQIQDDGNLVIYGHHPTWATATGGH